MESKRHTLSYPLKEPFSDAFEAKLARMPAYVRDRVVMKNVMPSKSMERD